MRKKIIGIVLVVIAIVVGCITYKVYANNLQKEKENQRRYRKGDFRLYLRYLCGCFFSVYFGVFRGDVRQCHRCFHGAGVYQRTKGTGQPLCLSSDFPKAE